MMHTAKQSSTENPVGMLHLDQYLTCLSSVVMWQQKPILASLEMKDNQCIDFDRTLSEKTALINLILLNWVQSKNQVKRVKRGTKTLVYMGNMVLK